MPYWSEVTEEIDAACQIEGLAGFDTVRRKYLRLLSAHTKRDTILYASSFKAVSDANVNFEDIHGLMAVMPTLTNKKLDFIIHSPGGLAEAAKAIVDYLRERFEHIRIIVPNFAFSAAAMIACAGDEIVMGKHSFLGPIDPQIVLQTNLGERTMAAQAIMQQFNFILQSVVRQPALFTLLNQYGPDLLITCQNASLLSRELAEAWLKKFMFAGEKEAAEHAALVANWLSEHSNFKSHGLTISRSELIEKGLRITNLEDDDDLQDLVLSVFHATSYLFNALAIAKNIENHNGFCYMKTLPGLQSTEQPNSETPQTPNI